MKRLITCSDGTWNKPGNTDRGKPVITNVERMFLTICDTDTSNPAEPVEQLKFYDQGIGTGVTLRDKLLGGITGAGIDKNIKDVYTFMVLNYQPGDEIYLFGFSRGAYTARSIGGLIRNCGILKPSNLHFINQAYDLYRDRNKHTSPESDLMVGFRKNYCWEDITPIKFIGVWDTVGSLGIPLPWYKLGNRNKYKFHDVTLSSTVENACHALAIDERRKLFQPTLWQKSETVKNDPAHVQKIEQRWFVGSHSNVGGGYADTGLSDLALGWLSNKANDAGLCYDVDIAKQIRGDYKGVKRNSYTALYWFWLPVWRSIDLENDDTQTIDESVRLRLEFDKRYRPKNLKRWLEKNMVAPAGTFSEPAGDLG